MRALFDTNVLISYLLSPSAATSAMGLILRAALAGRFTLLVTAGVAEELDRKLTERADLAARIPRSEVDRLLADFDRVAEMIPPLPGPLPPVGRDRKDDYLFPHASAGSADYLVTWDKGLLDLGRVGGVTIASPAEFLHIPRDTGRL